MKKIFKKKFKGKNKLDIAVFFILRILIIICMIREILRGNIMNGFLCVISLVLLSLPLFAEKKFKIDIPSAVKVSIYLFIYSSEILGEIDNFFCRVPYWDIMLHTLNGFLCASLGFSLVYLLNKADDSINLSPFFVTLVAFCFSMTTGVVWEIYEYSVDRLLGTDMQKDEYIETIKTVDLNPQKENKVVSIDNISYSILYDKKGNELVKLDKYLDIGLRDTMLDLIVNFIGAGTYSIFAYLYIKNEEKYKFAGMFVTKKISESNN